MAADTWWCEPWHDSVLHAETVRAVAAMDDAVTELRLAAPVTWAGSGADAYAGAVGGLLAEVSGLRGVLEAARRAAVAADTELASRVAGP